MSLDAKNLIARRVAQELQDGDCVNLGIGLPTLVADYVPAGIHVFFHSENGIMGVTPLFGIIRGGHPDITVLGGLEVDETGQLANWMVPGKMVPGMGGAMDLVTGAKRVIVAMTHRSPSGSKIVRRCSLPIASTRRVDLVVTELGVIRPTDDGLLLIETLPGVSAKDVQAASDAPLMLATGLA